MKDIQNRLLIGIGSGILCGIILDIMKTWCFVKNDDNQSVPQYTVLVPFPWPILFLIAVIVPLLIYILFFRKQQHRRNIIFLTFTTVLSMTLTTMLVGVYYSGNESGHNLFTIPVTVIVSTVFYSLAIVLDCFLIRYVHRLAKRLLLKMKYV